MSLDQVTPYNSFTAWKKYLASENAIPVPQRATLEGRDLELYTGNNAQLKSIQRNKIALNHMSGLEWANLGYSILGGVLGQTNQTMTAQQQQAYLQQQEQEREATRKNWQIAGIAFGILLLAGLAVMAIRSSK